MKELHLVCPRNHRLVCIEGNTWEVSAHALVSVHYAASLVGGRIYLHEAKADRSFFGGTITGWYHDERNPESAVRREITFRFLVDREGQGVRWRGTRHDRAHVGIVDTAFRLAF